VTHYREGHVDPGERKDGVRRWGMEAKDTTRDPRKEGAMTTSELPAWTMEDLWQGEQVNFAAHLAIMFRYLQAHDLDLDDFIRFVGEQVLPSWRGRGATVPIMLTGILRNVRANGGTVFEVTMTETRGEAIVSRLLRPDVMDRYGIPADQAERFWAKCLPIGQALGMRFTRTPLGDGRNQIVLERIAETATLF
jgi:hypothetical protein